MPMKAARIAWVMMVAAMLAVIPNALPSQICCGGIAVSLMKGKRPLSKEAMGQVKADFVIINSHSHERAVPRAMDRRDGYFLFGMWPMSEFEMQFERKGRLMTLRGKNPPGYEGKSFALTALRFRKGGFKLDDAQLAQWLAENKAVAEDGLFKGYVVIPSQFVIPLQEEK
jgi:hypothetical protein